MLSLCVSAAVQVRHPVTGGDGYVPCAPLDPGAQECTLQYFADKGIADQVVPPTITMKDFIKVLERARPTVSTKDLEVRRGEVNTISRRVTLGKVLWCGYRGGGGVERHWGAAANDKVVIVL